MIHNHLPSLTLSLAALALVSLAHTRAAGQPVVTRAPAADQTSQPAEPPAGDRWGFIICGHPGDAEHRELFADSAGRIREALIGRFGFPAENVWLRFGVEEDDTDLEFLPGSRGPATKEALAADAADLRQHMDEDAELWVIVIGHAHYANRTVQLNLPGPDVTPGEFAEWFAGFPRRRSVFIITTPLSGYFLKPLAQQGRVVISATEADLEVNETLFHSSLADVLETFPAGSEHDIDKDGVYSLLDLYLAVALDVAQRYADDELLATEHAQLDDNGDGRGSELQLDYLGDEDAPITARSRASRREADADGGLARSIDLKRLLSEP